MTNKTYTRYGNLKKQENLVLLKEKILPGTFVLESNKPFPGYYEYHQEIPFRVQPHYIYFVLKELPSFDKFIHASMKVKKSFKPDFSATIGTIEWRNKLLPIIRIRRLANYDQIVELQEAYINAGIVSGKKTPLSFNTTCMIHLKKFFMLVKLTKNIYKDAHDPKIAYFKIPNYVNWEHFVDTTYYVRNNVDLLQFDASKATLLEPYRIIHIIRIFSTELCVENIQQLRNKYLEKFNF